MCCAYLFLEWFWEQVYRKTDSRYRPYGGWPKNAAAEAAGVCPVRSAASFRGELCAILSVGLLCCRRRERRKMRRLSRRCEACFLPSESAHRQAGMRRRQPKAGAMLGIWVFVRKAAGSFSICAVCRCPGRCGRPSRPGAPWRAGAGGAALCGFALYAGERGVRFRAGDAAFSGRA